MACLHWAEDALSDSSRTACDLPVGYILAETSDDVTTDKMEVLDTPNGCEDCKDYLEELDG